MMTDTAVSNEIPSDGITHIKKELDGFHECSPSNSDMYSPTTTTVVNESGVGITKEENVNRSNSHFIPKGGIQLR